MARRQRIIDPDVIELALDSYRKGIPVNTILEEFDIPMSRFYSEIRRRGVVRDSQEVIEFTIKPQLFIELQSILGKCVPLTELTDEELLKVVTHRPVDVPVSAEEAATDEEFLLKVRGYYEVLGWSTEQTAAKLRVRTGSVARIVRTYMLKHKRLFHKLWLLENGVLAELVKRAGPQGAALNSELDLPGVQVLLIAQGLDRNRAPALRKITAADLDRDWGLQRAARRELELRMEENLEDEGEDSMFKDIGVIKKSVGLTGSEE